VTEFARSHDLSDLLCEHLRVAKERHLVWREVTLPSGGRADVFAIRPWGSMRDAVIYEVKNTRADFLSDMKTGKWRKYREFAHRLYFCTPAGLVKKEELPDGVGLIVWREKGFRVVKHARVEHVEWDTDFLISLIDRTHYGERETQQRALRERMIAKENGELQPIALRWGHGVATKLWEYDAMKAAGGVTGEAREAVEFMEQVRALAVSAGLIRENDIGGYPLIRMAEFAVAVMKRTEQVRKLGGLLTRLPYMIEADIEEILAA
jgi:hypothetical protein